MLNLLFTALVVLAGASLAFQQVVNADLRSQLGSPWWAGVVSYVVGLVLMLAMAFTVGGARLPSVVNVRGPWVIWAGGLFGSFFIATAILLVPRFGAAIFLALVVVGQMLGSLAFDQFGILGLPQHTAGPVRVVGAAFLILGVVLIRQ